MQTAVAIVAARQERETVIGSIFTSGSCEFVYLFTNLKPVEPDTTDTRDNLVVFILQYSRHIRRLLHQLLRHGELRLLHGMP